MEEKNELNDIILEKNENKLEKYKKILLVAASLILVFLVVLVIMKTINKPQNNEDYDLILPPVPKSDKVGETEDDKLFKQVPIIKDEQKKDNFEEMVENLKKREIQEQEKNQKSIKPEPVKAKEEAKAKKKPQTTKKLQTKKEQIKEPKITKNTTKKPQSFKKGYYIQVGATFKTAPDKRYLKTITTNGFEYTLYRVSVKGKTATKILIGPYEDKITAKNALPAIRKSVNKDAFVYRVR
jgi:DedD protein